MSRSRSDLRGVQDLRAIQRAFATAIMRPLTARQNMQPKWSDGQSTRRVAAGFIKPNDRLSSFERLEIYNRQYWFRVLDSLYEDFPGLRVLLGEKRFYALSVAYLAKHPSDSFTLRNLGRRLEKFLAREPRWVAPHAALARDLVRLEWAHIEAFDGETYPPLEIDDLLGSDPATLRLTLQPHITFLACAYPVDNFVLAARRQEEQRGEASNAMNERVVKKAAKKLARPRPEKIWLAVHRSDDAVYYKRLEPAACRMLAALRRGLTLQAACVRALGRKKADDEFGAQVRDWFSQWAALGWFYREEKSPDGTSIL